MKNHFETGKIHAVILNLNYIFYQNKKLPKFKTSKFKSFFFKDPTLTILRALLK